MSALEPCPGCGATFEDTPIEAHRYLGSSRGCWAAYGQVLAREFEDVRYGALHRLTVDSYAAQHPGVPSPQSIQSVAVHLIGLLWAIERGTPGAEATRALQRAAAHKSEFTWLDPPLARGEVTVQDLRAAGDPEAHRTRVLRWADAVWRAWEPHHATVRRWAELP